LLECFKEIHLPPLYSLCLDYSLQTSADLHPLLGFIMQKARSLWYLAKTITDVDYANDLDTISNANRLLHLVETVASEIGLHINAGKTEYISYNQQGVIEKQQSKNQSMSLSTLVATYSQLKETLKFDKNKSLGSSG